MRKKILIVDDEPDLLDLLRVRLEASGFDVITAGDGEDGLKKAQEKPDLILLDIMMPILNGLQVSQSLKETRETTDVPIIFLTARDDEYTRKLGEKTGGDAYLVKTCGINELLDKINAYI